MLRLRAATIAPLSLQMPHIFLLLGVLAVSAAPPLIRLAQPLPPIAVAFGRVGVAALCLVPLAGKHIREIARLPLRVRLVTLVAGVALGVHFALWIWSFEFTSTAAAVALVATQPVFAGLLGMLFLGEGFRRRELGGIAVAGLGCLVLAAGDLTGGSAQAIWGDALAVAGAIAVCVYLLAGRAVGDRLPLLPFMFAVNAVAACVLLLALVASGETVFGYASSDYAAVLGLALGPSLLGHTLLQYCVRRVQVHLVSLGILAEPVLGTLATWGFFGEVPAAGAGVGGAFILIGIALGFGGARSRAGRPNKGACWCGPA